ncbi:DUF3160 domain-containing protein [Nannocystis sp. ILAH1]|uniref:DUF3160 domain-containing protein n=1 Tax=Nannocystis sp. ILAH1 TaxID=2996789 RepID=UPI00226D8EB6|nr:DUF3160 domain-containing protein [Nannocystis sp. ILAH1]MCY0988499.1 DUF3160 domain-containing protein [Nannocystis sp. ILAH1]
MTLLRLSSSFIALALAVTACQPDSPDGNGPSPAPEVEQPAPDPWIAENYAPVQEEAKKLSVDKFLELYPQPAYVASVSYDALKAAGLDLIRPYAGLTDAHDKLLANNGFVAVDAAETQTFATTYLDIYDNDLPVLVTADSMLYALHKSFDSMLMYFERTVLRVEMATMLETSHKALGERLAKLPPELAAAAADLDVYLTVGRSLLSGFAQPFSDDPAVQDKVDRILAAAASLQPAQLDLFGVAVDYDFSQLKPRGHYEDDTDLQTYFQAMIWLGRTDLPMVVYDENQKPQFNRRGLDAAFLMHHVLQDSGAEKNWKRIDKTISLLIGERDSMSPADMTSYMDAVKAHTPEELVKLSDEAVYKALIDGDYGIQRIMSQIMYTDPNAPQLMLPRVFHLMGQRFTIDSYVFNNVTYDRVQDLRTGTKVTRMLPSELDVQFVLGNNAAGHHLKPELDEYGYQGTLHEMRFLVDSHPQEFWDGNFYNGWLNAIRALGDHSEFDNLPESMRTAAWADKGLNTQTASWAELRHDTLLYVKQSYSGGNGCEYIDAYVEPVPALYNRLAHLGDLGLELTGELGGEGFEVSHAQSFFTHLKDVSTTLESIAQKEIDGQALTTAEYDFLRGTIEMELVGCGEVQYDGWYGKLFFDQAKIAEFEPTIADVHTAPTDAAGDPKGWVLHAATGRPMLMVFTLEDCSGTRAYVGPVSSFHSVLTENYDRQTDSAWAEKLAGDPPARPSWTESFVR